MSELSTVALTEPALTVDHSWAELVGLTETMRKAAGREAWEEVVEMAIRRHRAVLDHFERFPVGPDNATFYHGRLTDMLQGEQELQTIAVAARREVMRRSVDSRTSHRAAGAYLSNR